MTRHRRDDPRPECRNIVIYDIIRQFSSRRRKWVAPFVLWVALSLATLCWLGEATGRALTVPPPPDQDLHHFRAHSDLQHYLDHIQLLIEPSSVCQDSAPPVIVMVSSAPSHESHRQVIRATWGKHLPTYFVLGLSKDSIDSDMVPLHIEAKQYSDIILYDFRDHYQNLTLKSVMMLQWVSVRCPGAKFLFKTDDDVVVNPWTLRTVLDEHPEAALLGYMRNASTLHRDSYNKWFVPRWLRAAPAVPRYLSGTGYLVRGQHLKAILSAAKKVPLINLEDVYVTYLVSVEKLNLDLVHDHRLSPYKPWIILDCAYWTLASIHSFDPDGIENAWTKIDRISKEYDKNGEVCGFYTKYVESEYMLY